MGCPKSLHLNLGERAAPLLQPLSSKGAHIQCREALSSDAPGGGPDDATHVVGEETGGQGAEDLPEATQSLAVKTGWGAKVTWCPPLRRLGWFLRGQ